MYLQQFNLWQYVCMEGDESRSHEVKQTHDEKFPPRVQDNWWADVRHYVDQVRDRLTAHMRQFVSQCIVKRVWANSYILYLVRK
eukprot:698837-Rhodomonas_salina.1